MRRALERIKTAIDERIASASDERIASASDERTESERLAGVRLTCLDINRKLESIETKSAEKLDAIHEAIEKLLWEKIGEKLESIERAIYDARR